MNQMIMDVLDDKKALDIISIDVSKVTTLTDHFIICTGTSDRHRKSLSDDVHERLSKAGVEFLSKEGYNFADWILLDYGDVVVNIFDKESRGKYSLERLWSDGILTELRRGDRK
jgi:ribosome-associated protein